MQKDLEGLSTGTHAKGMTEVLSKNGLQGLGVVEMVDGYHELGTYCEHLVMEQGKN